MVSLAYFDYLDQYVDYFRTYTHNLCQFKLPLLSFIDHAVASNLSYSIEIEI